VSLSQAHVPVHLGISCCLGAVAPPGVSDLLHRRLWRPFPDHFIHIHQALVAAAQAVQRRVEVEQLDLRERCLVPRAIDTNGAAGPRSRLIGLMGSNTGPRSCGKCRLWAARRTQTAIIAATDQPARERTNG